jgi:futalosine hydrolase
MRILVVAATEAELAPLISTYGFSIFESPEYPDLTIFRSGGRFPAVEILITGVGMVATAYALGRHPVGNSYDLVVNLGIAGSFDRSIPLGEIVEVQEDTLAELGAEDGDAFQAIEQLGFGGSVFNPSKTLADLYNLFNNFNLRKVNAITVNTVHGNETSIAATMKRLNPQIESMEGAAFFYACKQVSLPCIQIRAVSNYVEKRNRDNWEIGLAIKNLNNFAAEFLKLYA